jgi:adenylate cyclase
MIGLNGGSILGLLIPRGGGEDIPLLKTRLVVGRRESCDICLGYPNVSSKHSELEHINGYWQIRDLGSSNGTKVNGERVEAKWLMPGDEVGFGKHYYTIQYTPVGTVPTPVGEISTQVSLLEKAGLANQEFPRRPDRPSAKSSIKPTAPTPAPAPPARSSEDDAFDWING